MAALNNQTNINSERSFFLSTIPNEVSHSTITTDLLLANAAFISTLFSDNLNVSTINASTMSIRSLDISGLLVSSLRGNTGVFSTLSMLSDLSGGVGRVTFTADASGVVVSGDPLIFNNTVFLTSSINIVQVSTIVDTDIFVQNGFFSTLSSGTMVVGSGNFSTLQAEYGSFNRLVVSSLEALDISGVASSNWSLYPTLFSSVIFQPGNVLSNVGNKLYFAGTEITDLSGGGEDWSTFPALQDVSMNNFSLRGLSTLQYQDGATLVSQTGNNLLYNGQPVQFGAVSNVSQWANFPAVNTIQTGGFPITSPGNLTMTATSNTRLLANTVSTVADQGLLNLASFADINLTAQNGLKGRINLTANPGAAGVFGEINLTANGGTVAGVGTGGEINIIANTPLGLSNLTSAVNINAAGINSYAGVVPPIGSLAGYNFVYGTLGVSLVAGIPPSGFQVPGTTYLHGTNGVTTDSEFYVPSIYPYFNGLTTPPDLSIQGRVTNAQQVFVTLSNVKSMAMGGTAAITGANLVSAVSSIGSNAQFTAGSFGALASGNLGVTGDVLLNIGVGTTQAASLSTNSISTSVVTAALLSTQNINLSTINGDTYQPGSITTTPSFSTVTTSSIIASGGQNIVLEDYLEFRVVGGAYPGIIEGLNYINFTASNTVPSLTIEASTLNFFGVNSRFSGSISTTELQASSILVQTSLQSPEVSTGNLTVSSINGSSLIPTTTPTFDTVTTSSIIAVASQNVVFEDYIEFRVVGGLYPGVIENLNYINFAASNTIPLLTLEASSLAIVGATTLFTGSISTTEVQASTLAAQHVSTTGLSSQTSFLSTMESDFIDAQGLFVTRTQVPTGGGIEFQFNNDPTNFSRFQVSEVASNTMVCLLNNDGTPPGIPGSNLKPLGVAELWITGATFNYGAARLYAQPDYGNFGLDMIDANGATIIEALAVFGGPAGYTSILGSVSSITGFNDVGGTGNATGFDNIVTAPTISTQNLLCSTINGFPPAAGGGGSTISTFAVLEGSQFFTSSIQGFPVASYLNTNTFSTLTTSSIFTSSINFSTARYFGSNTGFYIPLILEQDHAQSTVATAADGVSLQIKGHNFQTGAIQNTVEMGVRGNGEGFILSYWPGVDLEDFYIDATDTIFRNSAGVSTIINQGSTYALRSATGGIEVSSFVTANSINTVSATFSTLAVSTIGVFQTVSTQSLLVSSIVGNDARPAYTNNFQTSTMALTASVAELGYWNSASPSSNINTSGYDCIVGVNGTYKMGCRIQGFNGSGGGGGSEEILLNFLKNSSTLTNVQTTQELDNNSEESIYMECLVPCVNGDNLQVQYFSSDNNIQVFATATSPAAILTVYKID